MIRQSHLIAVVRAFLVGCAVLLLVGGCAGVRSQAPQEVKQDHTEATKEQTHSSGAAASEEARCSQTRTYRVKGEGAYGGPGDDYGLFGDRRDDVIYGGDGEERLAGAAGEDVLHSGNGNDSLDGLDHSIGSPVGPTVRDELYCGPGKDKYAADRLDYVDSSCEEKVKEIFGGGGIA